VRYLVGFVCVLATLAALPLSASAQDAEEGTTPEPSLQESAPSSEPAPEEPALQLKLDEAGVEVVEMQRRVRNAKIGVGISGLSVLVGGVLLAITLDEGLFPDDPNHVETARDDRIGIAAATLLVGGLVSLLTTGIMVGVRKRTLKSHERKLRELQRDLPLGGGGARPQPRRVQWDLARSRLMF